MPKNDSNPREIPNREDPGHKSPIKDPDPELEPGDDNPVTPNKDNPKET